MARRLPPLNAVRAFEAAARHLSFIKAAEELHVTPAAISQQVRALEESLGVPLFRRLPRGLLLTDAGQGYWPALRDILDRLALVTERVRRQDEQSVLRLVTFPSFGARWLLPRLGRFRAAHPNIEVRINVDFAHPDFSRGDVDVAIHYSHGPDTGIRRDRLFQGSIFAVCSPRLLSGEKPLATPSDLRHHTLLHDEFAPDDWPEIEWPTFLAAAGVTDVDGTRGLRFSVTHLTLQAAIDGQGVALATEVLAGDDLASGRLVQLFDFSMPAPHGYYLLCPGLRAAEPKIAAFREWALAEAAQEP
ncbi:MAG TPA: transcriptional regulator GcvA [Alphaproteobacteria bacterium]|nr:transcriptional regulator GcvA [Alphaproteobacteria bacterium]